MRRKGEMRFEHVISFSADERMSLDSEAIWRLGRSMTLSSTAPLILEPAY